jgi:virginiamycin B lyase
MITVGPDGALWFTEHPRHSLWFAEYCGSGIGRIDERGKVTLYSLPPHSGTPQWITLGPDRAMWFTCFGGSQPGNFTHDL